MSERDNKRNGWESQGERSILNRVRLGLLARPWLLGITGVAYVAVIVFASANIVRTPEDPLLNPTAPCSVSDFHDYYQASVTLRAGEDPYRLEEMRRIRSLSRDELERLSPIQLQALLRDLKCVGKYLYPPFTAFLLTPLSGLSYKTAALVFQAVSIVALLGMIGLLYRSAVRDEIASRASLGLALLPGCLLVVGFVTGNASNGNIAFIILLLAGVGILFGFRDGVIWQLAGGVLVGFAAALKITPGFLGLVFLAGRRWYAIIGMAIGLAFALFIPSAAYGFDENWAHLMTWQGLIINTFSEEVFIRAWVNNQSIAGAIGKLFIPGMALEQGPAGLPLSDPFGHEGRARVDFYGTIARVLNITLYLGALVAAVIVAWRNPVSAKKTELRRVIDPQIVRILFIATVVSLVGSGVSWYHAYSVLLLPILLRAVSLASGHRPGGLDYAGLGILVFFAVLLGALPPLVRERIAIYSIFCWLCVIWVAFAILSFIKDRGQS